MEDTKPLHHLPNFKIRRCPAPILDTDGKFLTALDIEIEKTKRKLDAGKFLIEARMGLWDVRLPQHYFDDAHDKWSIRKAEILAERETTEAAGTSFLGKCLD